jgi:predicted enzyme related to lactoylglutathione lyase
MPDPFDALRTPLTPVEPDAAFAAQLRARVVRALSTTRGGSAVTDAIAATSRQSADTERPRQGDIAYVSLWVPDAERATTFFSHVLGWRYADVARPGRAHQVEGLNVSHGIIGDQPRSTLLLCFTVDDVDAALERVRSAGGATEPAMDEPYGRVAGCTDDQGVRFAVHAGPASNPGQRLAPNGAHVGDVAYLTLEVEDSARARAFYAAAVGWRFTPGRVQDGWSIENVVPMAGMSGGHGRAAVVPMYRVDDIEAAVERVRQAGGTASEVSREPYGQTSECVDDQGTRFYLGQL